MSLYQSQDGTWRFRVVAEYADGTKRRISGTAPRDNNTKAAVRQMEADALATMRTMLPPSLGGKGTSDVVQLMTDVARSSAEPTATCGMVSAPSEPAKHVPTVDDFFPVYIASCRGRNRRQTLIGKECLYRFHVKPRIGHLRLDELTFAVIDDVACALQDTYCLRRERKLSLKTIHNVMIMIGHMLRLAKRRGHITFVPEIQRIKFEAPPIDFLDFSEKERFLAVADPEWLDMFIVALNTGMRKGELQGLWKADVDLIGKKVTVSRTFSGGAFGPTKGGSIREIPLNDAACAALARAMAHDRGKQVFCQPDGKPFTKGHLVRPMKRACIAAGLGRQMGWHRLRHTFASHAAMLGVPMRVLQAWMGHSSMLTTQRYSHLSPDVSRDMILRLDARPTRNPPQDNPAVN